MVQDRPSIDTPRGHVSLSIAFSMFLDCLSFAASIEICSDLSPSIASVPHSPARKRSAHVLTSGRLHCAPGGDTAIDHRRSLRDQRRRARCEFLFVLRERAGRELCLSVGISGIKIANRERIQKKKKRKENRSLRTYVRIPVRANARVLLAFVSRPLHSNARRIPLPLFLSLQLPPAVTLIYLYSYILHPEIKIEPPYRDAYRSVTIQVSIDINTP